jgi:hypothetical protein
MELTWLLIEDAITICVRSGYSPGWIILLDCENFAGVYESVKRVEARELITQTSVLVNTAHPDKRGGNIKKLIKMFENWLPFVELKLGMKGSNDLERLFTKNK